MASRPLPASTMSLLLRSSLLILAASTVAAQQPPARGATTQPPRRDSAVAPADSARGGAAAYNGLRFRSIGPALTSGRVGDIAVHPTDHKVWYVAVSSGGLWKTTNA